MTEKINKRSNTQKIIGILRNYKHLGTPYLWLLLFSSISYFGALGYPFVTKRLVQGVESQIGLEKMLFIFGVGTIYILIVQVMAYIRDGYGDKYFSLLSNKITIEYRKLLSKKSVNLIIDEGSGKLISKFEQGISAEVELFFSISRTILIVTIRGLTILVVYYLYDLRLVFIVLAVGLIYGGMELFLGKRIEAIGEEQREINELKTKNLVKYLSEFLTIKIRSKFDRENGEYDRITEKLPYLSQKSTQLGGLKGQTLYTLFVLVENLLFVILGYNLIETGYKISDIVFLGAYIRWLWWPLEELISSFSMFQNRISKYSNLQEFLNTPQTIINGTQNYKYNNGDIDIDNISFSYNEDKQILHDFSLHIPGGKTLALVGNSGSGKSTIIKLLLRLYDPQSGTIMIDNQNLKDLKIESLYDSIGYLTQEPAVFDGSIRDNMMYGAPRDVIARNGAERNDEAIGNNENQIATTEQNRFPNSSQGRDDLIRQALDHAKCDFVRSMKDGLETQIGERGVKLSGGERQRLAIARIFFKNPHILILDEPTAALDSISEHHITNTLHDLFANKTVIVIAHRLQTVMNADQIIVLNEGKIVQSGKHEELLSQDGLYKQLVDLQSGVVKEE